MKYIVTLFVALAIALLLQGCVYGLLSGLAYEEYKNYTEYAEQHGHKVMSQDEYWAWSSPQCVDRQHCDRDEVKNKDYRTEL